MGREELGSLKEKHETLLENFKKVPTTTTNTLFFFIFVVQNCCYCLFLRCDKSRYFKQCFSVVVWFVCNVVPPWDTLCWTSLLLFKLTFDLKQQKIKLWTMTTNRQMEFDSDDFKNRFRMKEVALQKVQNAQAGCCCWLICCKCILYNIPMGFAEWKFMLLYLECSI